MKNKEIVDIKDRVAIIEMLIGNQAQHHIRDIGYFNTVTEHCGVTLSFLDWFIRKFDGDKDDMLNYIDELFVELNKVRKREQLRAEK